MSIVIDGNGNILENYNFPNEETLNQRQKELEIFLKCVEKLYYDKKISILSDAPKNWFCDIQTKREFFSWLFLHNHKVNGNVDEWNNGFLGSRWCDKTFNGRKIRIAFYNKNEFETYGNNYKLFLQDYFN